jgi:hypothetical protein
MNPIADISQERGKRVTMIDPVSLAVDYNRSLEQMIAAGNYDSRHEDFNEGRICVDALEQSEVDASLFSFEYCVTSAEVLDSIAHADKQRAWSVAKVEHILAFGEEYPDEQLGHAVVGLGSLVATSGGLVPYLDNDGFRRRLHLRWWGSTWPPYCRFLAIRSH